MNFKKRKNILILAVLAVAGALLGGGTLWYMFNMPHKDVQNSNANFSLSSSLLVSEYLSDSQTANEKYLAEDGNSKILEVTGTVAKISENFNGEKLVLLKEDADKAGVSCTFSDETGADVMNLNIGETITVKGIIRSGAAYDEDLELYEHVVLDKCNIVTNK